MLVAGFDLDGSVHAARRRTADEQRDRESGRLHFGSDMHHLIEAGCDQTGHADDVGALVDRGLQDRRSRHHDTEIDDLVVVAGQHDPDNVLADVVNITLRRGEHNLAGLASFAVFALHEGLEVSDGLLHDASALHDLRQEHLARAEEIADNIHAVHQRTLDHVECACRFGPAASSASSTTNSSSPCTSACTMRSCTGSSRQLMSVADACA